jgi:hypothetical protein
VELHLRLPHLLHTEQRAVAVYLTLVQELVLAVILVASLLMAVLVLASVQEAVVVDNPLLAGWVPQGM